MSSKLCRVVLSSAFALLAGQSAQAAVSAEERSLIELRNTVVNLLQGLVERGVLTREQAEAMVKNAQTKAEADAVAKAAQDKERDAAEAGAVRVPYVPQIVKDEIRKEVVAELTPAVTDKVVQEAKTGSGLRAALPDWVNRFTWSGDVRVRGEGVLYAPDNAQNVYLDFTTINSKGGVSNAGPAALLNTSQDRERMRYRLRFGFEAALGDGWTAAARLATGSLSDPVSTNQTLGAYGNRSTVGVDQAYIRWSGDSSSGGQSLSATGGRIANPWLASDMVWDPDLVFEGVAANYRLNFGSERSNVFLTAGAFPLQEIELSTKDKWLFGGQAGFDWRTSGSHRYRFGVAYYDYQNISGRKNSPDSSILDYTAPTFIQKGNTLFDIRNSSDGKGNLYALAAEYRLVDVLASAEWALGSRYRVSLLGDYVKNVGYDEADVLARTGSVVPARNKGYDVELGFGTQDLNSSGAWKVAVAYRYLQRDAVLDAFTDSDFHIGGTDAKGYVIQFDYAANPRVWARLRYLSANEIDGPPLGIDVWQLDLNTRF
jgi:Putative porin